MKHGERYGQLVFLEDYKIEINGKFISVGLGKFICDCGSEYIGKKASVKYGNNKSCGCLVENRTGEAMRKKNIKYGTNIGKIRYKRYINNKKTYLDF